MAATCRKRSTLRAVAECNAEVALARLVNVELKQLNNCYSLVVTHKPSRGGHDRVIMKTLRLASKGEVDKVILFIDSEEDRSIASSHYTEQLCNEVKQVVYHAQGASVTICKKIIAPRQPRGAASKVTQIYAVVWRPRSEEVLKAATGHPRSREEEKRLKRDPNFVERLLKETIIPFKVAEALNKLLESSDP